MKPSTAWDSSAKCGIRALSKASDAAPSVAEPDREDRLALLRCACSRATWTTDCAASRRRGECGRHVHHQNRVVRRIGEQRLERRRVARAHRHRPRYRPGWRATRSAALRASSRASVSGAISARRAAEIDQAVDREHADAAAVGQNGEALAVERLDPPERFGGREQFVQPAHAQQAGAPESRVVNLIRRRRARPYGSRRRARPARGGRT